MVKGPSARVCIFFLILFSFLQSFGPLGLRRVTKTLTYVVQFIVEAASVAHRVPVGVTPPECGGGGLTVGTAGASTPGGRLWRAREVRKWQSRTKSSSGKSSHLNKPVLNATETACLLRLGLFPPQICLHDSSMNEMSDEDYYV